MLHSADAVLALLFSILLIITGYQLYFLPQRMPIKKASVGKLSILDKRIPFRPGWVWIYSLAYYPYILSAILTLSNLREFYSMCLSYMALLFSHIIISYFYPVRTPAEWRSYTPTCASTRFLKFVQRIDKGGNCFPSMHVAVATLTAIHITANSWSEVGSLILLVWIVPVLISASALFTKQHVFADLLPGVVLAILVFFIYRWTLELLALAYTAPVLLGVVFLGFLVFFLTAFRPQRRQRA